jgi:hypothetical protein
MPELGIERGLKSERRRLAARPDAQAEQGASTARPVPHQHDHQ